MKPKQIYLQCRKYYSNKKDYSNCKNYIHILINANSFRHLHSINLTIQHEKAIGNDWRTSLFVRIKIQKYYDKPLIERPLNGINRINNGELPF